MRRMSKAAKADAYDALSLERDLWSEVAHIHIRGEQPDASEVIDHSTRPDVVEESEAYVFHLYRVLRGHGGILVELHMLAGQGTSVNVYVFDEWVKSMEAAPFGIGISTERKIACERLQTERRRIFDGERASSGYAK